MGFIIVMDVYVCVRVSKSNGPCMYHCFLGTLASGHSTFNTELD